MNDEDTFEFEDRQYISPTITRDERIDFINNYRNAMAKNVERINRETHNLGTDVPSNIGGLTGSDRTFETRYVTPKVNQTVADLQAVAQGEALTQALSNLRAEYKKRYNDAYRAAKARSYSSGGNNNNSNEESNVDITGEGAANTTTTSTAPTVSQAPTYDPNSGEGFLQMTGDGVGTYYSSNGNSYSVKDINKTQLSGDYSALLGTDFNPLKVYNDGDVVTGGNRKYVYAKNSTHPGVWLRITD